MEIVNMHEAKTHLSRLVERAARGESFIIAKAGKPLVKVVAVEPPSALARRRVGFLVGEIAVPDDFDRMGQEQIEALFGGGR
ncbi:MAG: type II toxin-antitoxin system prevent-host-death family antitoxin [Betaproteobacteria bacterium]|uniref:type II toxin-antitoxin system Phd/YefM family antitoxin n=1 Tax=Thiomonas sp. FB-6 TaxID=1158291 RepID=UPI00037C3652|nr:type II toxin-antitoxin system prevent-host-death family antitoxin [Thiomonas sp. FB-6]MBU6440936.1 type II toxin-antitoxin system prevent-host-death family antitoxin [Betaproteobacteria bacterium]MBU6512815.1 type II toxin-antitoxin system prevent-host-death family antitoxin [Betaproteobacteria bacterium]MDE1955145.1 type II toxin-antitoxin system prevent-host-death family antitoxin [Betaproteobacteria bacterium]MDE2150812.1 type II toxin-antitoxin system prevent-host-death family antitoxin